MLLEWSCVQEECGAHWTFVGEHSMEIVIMVSSRLNCHIDFWTTQLANMNMLNKRMNKKSNLMAFQYYHWRGTVNCIVNKKTWAKYRFMFVFQMVQHVLFLVELTCARDAMEELFDSVPIELCWCTRNIFLCSDEQWNWFIRCARTFVDILLFLETISIILDELRYNRCVMICAIPCRCILYVAMPLDDYHYLFSNYIRHHWAIVPDIHRSVPAPPSSLFAQLLKSFGGIHLVLASHISLAKLMGLQFYFINEKKNKRC